MEAYKKRATMGGDPEEVRISLFEISKAQEILG
jgi:hypothetical protein